MKLQGRNAMRALLPALLLLAHSAKADNDPSEPQEPWWHFEVALSQVGVQSDTKSLIDEINSPQPSSRMWMAIEILGLRREYDALPVLTNTLQTHQDRFIRENAALALARLGDSVGLKSFVDFVHSSSDWRRQLYLSARLAELGDDSAYRYVVAATESPEPQKRKRSIQSLIAFFPLDHSKEKSNSDPAQRFLAMVEDADPEVRLELIAQSAVARANGISLSQLTPIFSKLSTTDPDSEVREQSSIKLRHWALEERARKRRLEIEQGRKQ